MREYKVPPIPESIWRNPLHFIAFGFGVGAIPIAPGTFGTLMGIPFYLILKALPCYLYFVATIIIIILSILICNKVDKEMESHDHQGMCLDEVVGFVVTMFAMPFALHWIVIGFILFRIFDIWKPFPIWYIDEKMPGGAGIILDDVAAGIYSCIILHFLRWIF